MSSIHPKICPIMSRAVTFSKMVIDNEDGNPNLERNELLIKTECLQEGCAWWIDNEQECSVKWSTLMIWALAELKEDNQ